MTNEDKMLKEVSDSEEDFRDGLGCTMEDVQDDIRGAIDTLKNYLKDNIEEVMKKPHLLEFINTDIQAPLAAAHEKLNKLI